MQTEIFEYITKNKNSRKQKIGIILGAKYGDEIRFGWSKCNEKAGDTFDRVNGLNIARERAGGVTFPITKEPIMNCHLPSCMKRKMRQFAGRCIRYFKDAKKVALIE